MGPALKRRSFRLLEKFFGKSVLAPQSLELKKIRRVLVIRQHDQLGDFLLATPVLRALRETLPDARIGLLVREYFEDLASMIPFVDELLVFYKRLDRWTWRRFRQLSVGLRGRWDLCIVLNTVSHSLTSDLLAHLSRSPFVVGSAVHVFPGCGRNFFYNLISPVHEEPRHQTDRNLDIVRYIGIDTADRREVILVSPHDQQQAREYLRSLGVRFIKPLVGMHIGAGKRENRWPVHKFAEVARALHYIDGAEILVFRGPSESDLLTAFDAGVDFPAVKIPPTNLRSLASLFPQCDVIVCNDSGPMHIAAATGTPIVALFGRTDPNIWKPIGDKFDYVRSPDESIENIKSETVVEKVRFLIHHNKKTTAVHTSIGEVKK